MSSGGARKGAGRKASPAHLKRNTITIRLPQWVIDQLPEEGRGETIERLLVAYHGLKIPK